MGYCIRITRSEWTDADEDPGRITRAEWRHVAESDPDLDLDLDLERESDTEFCFPDRESGFTFYYFKGTVSVKSPDEATIRKIFEVARKLNATVQGDDHEYYRLTERGIESYEGGAEDGG